MKKRIGIQGFFIFLALALAIFLSRFIFPQWKNEVLEEVLDFMGVGIVLFGLFIRIIARGYKAELSKESRVLVTGGLYNLVRNPMYFGTLLIGLGLVSTLFQWWAFFFFFSIFLIIYIPQVQREEKKLQEHFGQEYKDYCAQTPRFFPNTFKLLKADPREYLSFKWGWAIREFPSWAGALLAIIVIETWEDMKIFGGQALAKEPVEIFLIIIFFVSIFAIFHEKKSISGE